MLEAEGGGVAYGILFTVNGISKARGEKLSLTVGEDFSHLFLFNLVLNSVWHHKISNIFFV